MNLALRRVDMCHALALPLSLSLSPSPSLSRPPSLRTILFSERPFSSVACRAEAILEGLKQKENVNMQTTSDNGSDKGQQIPSHPAP